MPTVESLKWTRRSYSREQKLDVLKWYSLNLYCTCQRFSLNTCTKTVLRWIKNQSAIYDSKKGRKRVQFRRTAEHPDIEETLYIEYRGLRQSGLKVKGWWFQDERRAATTLTAYESSVLPVSCSQRGVQIVLYT